MPGGKPKGAGEIESVYFSRHDLRSVFSRENTERRRESGHTMRKYLTAKQDKQLLSAFIKIRAEYDVTNNSDAAIVWAQQQIEAGKEDELHEKLVAAAKSTVIPKRAEPWDDERGH